MTDHRRHPRLTIKSYRSCTGNEGEAFSCTLYLDGKRMGTVKYDGWGGPFMYEFWKKVRGEVRRDEAKERAVREYCESRPDIVCSFEDPETGKPCVMKADVDLVVGEVIEDHQEERQLRSWCRTKVVFKLRGTKDGEYMTLAVRFAGNEERVRKQLARKYGDRVEEIVNERFAA